MVGDTVGHLEQHRQCDVAPCGAGAGGAVGAADPDDEDVVSRYRRRPGIAEAVGRAGLEGDLRRIARQAARHAAGRGGRTLQDTEDFGRAGAAHQAAARVFVAEAFFLHAPDQRLGDAAIPERGIEDGEFARREACAAEREGEACAVTCCAGEAGARARHGELGGETFRTDPVQHQHGGNVEGVLQRIRYTHVAPEHPVEVFRPVAGESAGQVFDAGVGGGDAVIEGEAVDERFER